MTDKVVMYCGRPIEELSREELIEALTDAYAEIEDLRASRDRALAIGGPFIKSKRERT